MMEKKTKAKKEIPKVTSQEEIQEEIENLRNQNLSLEELHNLKDGAYCRARILNTLNRIALAIENLELSEEESSEENQDEI